MMHNFRASLGCIKPFSIINKAFGTCALDFNYNRALVRELPKCFADGLKISNNVTIDFEKAQRQHLEYLDIIRNCPTIEKMNILEASEEHPDCNFIEDTAFIVKNHIFVSHMGDKARRGEEIAILKFFEGKSVIVHQIKAPGTVDGGDILFAGRHIFVGISKRTNMEAFQQIISIINEHGMDVCVVPIYMDDLDPHILHLKSAISMVDHDTIAIVQSDLGRHIQKQIIRVEKEYKFLELPSAICCNVLRIGVNVVMQAHLENEFHRTSQAILQDYCTQHHLNLVTIEHMSEFIKSDGALTCGSLLYSV